MVGLLFLLVRPAQRSLFSRFFPRPSTTVRSSTPLLIPYRFCPVVTFPWGSFSSLPPEPLPGPESLLSFYGLRASSEFLTTSHSSFILPLTPVIAPLPRSGFGHFTCWPLSLPFRLAFLYPLLPPRLPFAFLTVAALPAILLPHLFAIPFLSAQRFDTGSFLRSFLFGGRCCFLTSPPLLLRYFKRTPCFDHQPNLALDAFLLFNDPFLPVRFSSTPAFPN